MKIGYFTFSPLFSVALHFWMSHFSQEGLHTDLAMDYSFFKGDRRFWQRMGSGVTLPGQLRCTDPPPRPQLPMSPSEAVSLRSPKAARPSSAIKLLISIVPSGNVQEADCGKAGKWERREEESGQILSLLSDTFETARSEYSTSVVTKFWCEWRWFSLGRTSTKELSLKRQHRHNDRLTREWSLNIIVHHIHYTEHTYIYMLW